jgi:hypothetical protein
MKNYESENEQDMPDAYVLVFVAATLVMALIARVLL